jgi:signal transduction histidine kinase
MNRRVPKKSSLAFNEEEFNYDLLHRLTEQAPGAIFQLEVKPDGEMRFNFMSRGIEGIHPDLNPEMIKENPRLGFSSIHPEDLQTARLSMHEARRDNKQWISEFRVVDKLGNIHWHSVNARPEVHNDGTVIWFGIFQDITESKAYTQVLEQILFDISHVIRRPASSIIGLTDMIQADIQSGNLDSASQMIQMLKSAAGELDDFIHQLNEAYVNRRQSLEQKRRA